MKASLKRIEATLKDLGKRENPDDTQPVVTNHNTDSFSFTIGSDKVGSDKVGSDKVGSGKYQQNTEFIENVEEPFFDDSSIGESEDILTGEPHSSLFSSLHNASVPMTNQNCVETFSTNSSEYSTPNLPKFKPPQFTNHRNGVNSALAGNILREISIIVESWHSELKATIRQIQDIYIEGPIINGWLESDITSPPEKNNEQAIPESDNQKGKATLRHGEVDQLMDYIEEICAVQEKATNEAINKSQKAGYRLCGLDDSGQVWSRPCPQEEIPSISMGIARYHKLRQFLARKQYLENKLNNIAENLVVLHGNLNSDLKPNNSKIPTKPQTKPQSKKSE
ncbi:MAG: hypothetical protein ACFB02_16265 [Mastigocoleus sp.]